MIDVAANMGGCHRCDLMRRVVGAVSVCDLDGEPIDRHATSGVCGAGVYGTDASGTRRRSLPVYEPKPRPAWLVARVGTREQCEHYLSGKGRHRCAVFVARGKAGDLMHPRGLLNPHATCPAEPPKFGPATTVK